MKRSSLYYALLTCATIAIQPTYASAVTSRATAIVMHSAPKTDTVSHMVFSSIRKSNISGRFISDSPLSTSDGGNVINIKSKENLKISISGASALSAAWIDVNSDTPEKTDGTPSPLKFKTNILTKTRGNSVTFNKVGSLDIEVEGTASFDIQDQNIIGEHVIGYLVSINY